MGNLVNRIEIWGAQSGVELTTWEEPPISLTTKIIDIPWMLLFLITAIACVGFAMLYSAGNGNMDPWASRQIIRFCIGMFALLVIASLDLRYFLRFAYHIYGLTLLLLIVVEVKGQIGMGAQRWLNLGFINLQPSELMKISIILALSRYFHNVSLDEINRPLFLFPGIIMVLTPAFLVLRQPDLGTALMLIMVAWAIFFIAGVRLWKFAMIIILFLIAIPIGWEYLKDYQKDRILTFLDPERDPTGAGYHILQSKIAFGSGGMWGSGFMQGTQTHLNFLPEKQTDFIFTMFAEEIGMVGGIFLIGMFTLVLVYCYIIAFRSKNQFGRLIALGVSTNFFLYLFINIAMVMGLLPVVGVPLPLISYGGTAMLTVLIGFGLICNVLIHRESRIGKQFQGGE